MECLPKYNYILASKSPRRQELLKSLGIDFSVNIKDVDEIYPDDLRTEEVPVYLSKLKAKPYKNSLKTNDLLITADTVVCVGNEILGKPKDKNDAKQMLNKLSNRTHKVITGVCLSSKNKSHSFYGTTLVSFKELSNIEIEYYINEFKPFDKAGAYGIQEWIGSIGIQHIEGSFYNVMGLPIQKLYEEIRKF